MKQMKKKERQFKTSIKISRQMGEEKVSYRFYGLRSWLVHKLGGHMLDAYERDYILAYRIEESCRQAVRRANSFYSNLL